MLPRFSPTAPLDIEQPLNLACYHDSTVDHLEQRTIHSFNEIMASYDTLTISSHAAPLDIMRLTPAELNSGSQTFSHDLDFQYFDNGQDGLSQMPFTPSYELDGFTTTFDDPLSYQSNMFENFLDEAVPIADAAPAEMDNGKLLGFGSPTHKNTIFDQSGQTWPRMSAELNGMFCVAEDVFEGDAAGRPLELTCYRRNLFQISGTITLSRTASQVLLDQTRRVQINELVASLTATESIEGKATDIIAMPWKSGGVSGVSSEDKTGSAPTDIPIDLSSNQETDPAIVSIPIAWGRLQFKYATANNGRRKGLQQHYRIQITLMAKLEGESQPVKLAEIQSNPIIVRGRSPKNFDSSKDVPLNEKKAEASNRIRASSVVSTPQWIEPALSQTPIFYSARQTQPFDAPSWSAPSPSPTVTEHRSKKLNTSSPTTHRRRPPVPQTQWESEPQELSFLPPNLPVSLSLSDEEASRSASGSQAPTLPLERKPSQATVTSPVESADQLYEYFPLSLDDWMPPVDAVYRPHVVHHLHVPPEIKAQQVRTKPKRYFSAED